MRFFKNILLVITCLTSSSSFAFGEIPNWDLDYMIETCGSLNDYETEYTMCTKNNFTYPTIEVFYYTSSGREVLMEVKQAKLVTKVYDSFIKTIQVTDKCNGCSIDVLDINNDVAQGLVDNINNNTLMEYTGDSTTSSITISGFKKIDIIKAFAGLEDISFDFTLNGAFSLASDNYDNNDSGDAIEIISDADGTPRGSSRLVDGKDVADVILENTDSGREWTGTVDLDLGYLLVSTWTGATGGTMVCQTTYEGVGNEMVVTISCTYY